MSVQNTSKLVSDNAETAFLSARVPVPLKNRFKALAAERGAKVQDLLQQIVQNYVDDQSAGPLAATDVIARLRGVRGDLEGQGIGHLYLFGSLARGEAQAGSDIDLSYEPKEGAQLSLFDLARLREVLEVALEMPGRVDLAPRARLAPHVAEAAANDELRIF
ncbi:nucleotidyltransferase family protein [Roseibium alexandrii]|uniref:Putative nucleotidyltransferase n=1 Tax=Roseibium alexandrii (strain DSM 17067 / NCIMB 14079 / DFL-11) TaxID=244592 RepID=A0A5E8H6D1_ROSAD|nr:nucleotidyltransferase domain-containing protein [Roseibium alexandrii]EEE48077.2 putative nucleotidyltransferase [Roseibium alexandrii DFL-11]